MIKTFRHKGLNNFFNNGDTTKIQSDHIKKLRLLLANLNAATNGLCFFTPPMNTQIEF